MHYSFLQYALWTGMLVGFIAPLLGVFIVIRKQSLIADALSHITLAGISFSLLLSKKYGFAVNWNPLYMGIGFSVVGSLLIEKLRTVYKHFQELAIPIIMSAGIGLSSIFLSIAGGFNTDLFSYLFGSLSAVSRADFRTILGISIFVVLCIILLYKELFIISFDEEYAQVTGIPTKFVHFIFVVMVALVIAATMRVVGILLVSSLITLPVAASIRIAKGFKQTIFFSIIFGETAVISGIFMAYIFNIAPGGMIVINATIILILAALYKKLKSR